MEYFLFCEWKSVTNSLTALFINSLNALYIKTSVIIKGKVKRITVWIYVYVLKINAFAYFGLKYIF